MANVARKTVAARGTSYTTDTDYDMVYDCRDIQDDNILSNTTSRVIGVVVSLWCPEDYEISGQSVITCEEEGVWSDTPRCLTKSKGNSQIIIIIVSAAAAAVALGVLLGALYMLFTNFRKERKAKVKAQEFIEHLKELRIYQAVTQDCVGMPPLVYDNMNATLRGRPSSSDESAESSPAAPSSAETEMTSEKAFIY